MCTPLPVVWPAYVDRALPGSKHIFGTCSKITHFAHTQVPITAMRDHRQASLSAHAIQAPGGPLTDLLRVGL
jgi:hypothetical protein